MIKEIKKVINEKDASRVTEFLLSANAFDKDKHTIGEVERIKENPKGSIESDRIFYWFIENDINEVIAVVGIRENDHKTGGYIGDFLAVHKNYRKSSTASKLIEFIIDFIKRREGRYFIAETGDIEAYKPMHSLLDKMEFSYIGHYPDYYSEGEGKVVYYKKINV